MERMQRLVHANTCSRIIKETKRTKREFDSNKTELDRWCKELSDREALTICDRRKIEEESKMEMPLPYPLYSPFCVHQITENPSDIFYNYSAALKHKHKIERGKDVETRGA
ncbi:unnamed protein product [Dovyalis caffra]|uniref:Uncharacterized protein n=1 Tax=Dovyalis caffra TaxID=77055 RepID=A0AAV1RND2_9ROSI|nr:unnamed protein product [Dovyalis caffra]